MQRAVDLAILAFVTSTMLALGLRVPAHSFLQAIRDRRTILLGSLVNVVVLPIIGAGVAAAPDLGTNLRTGFVLIAISPGAPFAIKLVELARGDLASALGLLIPLQLVGCVTVPVLAGLFLESIAEFSVREVLGGVLLLQLVPLLLGLAAQNMTGFGPPIERVTGALSNLSFGVLVLLLLVADSDAFIDILAVGTLLAIIGFIALAFILGYLSGGDDPAKRKAVSLVTAGRKGGLALVVATATFGSDSSVVTMVVAFALVELILLTSVATWWMRKAVDPLRR
jgi:bile acid:Na+ symporter, BASS family